MPHVEIALKEAVESHGELFDQAREIARTLGRPVVLALNGDHYDIQPLAPTTEQTALEVTIGPLTPPFEACEVACYRATTQHRVAILRHQEVAVTVFPDEEAKVTYERWKACFDARQRGEHKDEEVIDPAFEVDNTPSTAPELLRELDQYMAGMIEIDALVGFGEGGKALAMFVKRELIGLEKRPETARLEAENANIPEPDEPAWARELKIADIFRLLREATGCTGLTLNGSDIDGWCVTDRGIWGTHRYKTQRAAILAAVRFYDYKGPKPTRDPIDEIVCHLVSIEGVKKVQLEFEKECGAWCAQIPAPNGTRMMLYTPFYSTPLLALRKLKEAADEAIPF